jgi:deazaflavin-dependent oxidoreductase (nitroreductase family)
MTDASLNVSRRTSGPASQPVRPDIASRRPHLVVASLVLAAPGWIAWLLRGRHGSLTSPVTTSLILAANIALTRMIPTMKGRVVRLFQKYVVNPPIRFLLQLGVLPVGYALLETTGRNSGKPRRTPVGNGLVGETFWIVAEHGHSASYVRNLQANPRVRVKVRHRLRPVWREGVAHILEADDPHARQRQLSRWHPLRALNAAFVRVMGSELLTIRIDLNPHRPPPAKPRLHSDKQDNA